MLWSSQFPNAVSVRVSAVVGLGSGGWVLFKWLALAVRKRGAVRGHESGFCVSVCREVSGEEKGSKCGPSEDNEVVDGRQLAKAVEGEL